MADAAVTKVDLGVDNKATLWTWAALTQAAGATPQGVALDKNFIEYADRSIQVEGTFGGATLVLEGSNDGVNYRPLTDASGVAISKTAAGLSQITEMVAFLRPRVTGGDGTTALVVTIAARKAHR